MREGRTQPGIPLGGLMVPSTDSNPGNEPGRERAAIAPAGPRTRADRDAMNRMFRETLAPLFAGLAMLMGLLAVINYFAFPRDGLAVLLTELAVALILILALLLVRRVSVPLAFAHPAGVLAAWLALTSNLVHLNYTANPWKSMETILIIVGLGSLLLSRPWLVVGLAGVLVSWFLVARRILTESELRTVGYSLLTAAALSAMVQHARIRTFQRLERLRRRDEERKGELQQALGQSEHELQERRKTELALRDSERRYRLLVDMAPVAIIVHVAGVARFVNRAALNLMKVASAEEIVGRPVLNFIDRRDQAIAEERIRRVQELNIPNALGEIRMVRADGQVIEVEAAAAPILFEGLAASQVVLLDVTQRKRTDERLRVMQFAIDHAGEALLWMDSRTRIVYANIQACEVLDYTMKEMLELSLGDLDPRFRDESTAFGERALGRGKTVTLEREFRRRDGTLFPAEITVNRLRHEALDVHIIFMRDITDRKRTEAVLRENEERFRTIFDESPLGMAIIDRQLRFLRVNAMLARLMGTTPVELMRLNSRDIKLTQLEGYDLEAIRSLIRGDISSLELELKWKGEAGRQVWAHVHAVLIRGQAGDPDYGLAMVEDVTQSRLAEAERQRLEEQLRQAQKMEAVGTLAGGVAHDFNNLLTGILGYASILKKEAPPGTKVHKAAEIIERAGERARDLTGQLLGFARKGKNQNIAINLNGTIRDVVTLLKRTIPKSIRIHHYSDSNALIVRGDPNQLEQVFLNLSLNARDAMRQGGDLTFRTEAVTLDEDYCARNPGAAPGAYVQVSVSDTGLGIPRDVQDRIFEPFFTTKDPGQGTGMGLAMVYGIVKNHGGTIRVYSEPGHGATFKVLLPLVDHGVEDPEAEEPLSVVPGVGRILVVDDEEVVRTLLNDMLGSMGYEVVVASGGREAVEYYRRFSREVDLVILDMVMPEMGGRECFRALKEINPDVRAVLSTGYGRDGAAQEILDEGMVGFAQKPYRANQLSQVVHRALQEAAPRAGGLGA